MLKQLRSIKTVFIFSIFIIGIIALYTPVNIQRFQQESPHLLDKNGEFLHIERTPYDTWQLKLNELDPVFVELLIQFEDKHFYIHPGVNPFALVRATWQAIKYRKIISGGSTLTMQVSRLLQPGHRTFIRKIWEIFTALRLTAQYSKADILKMYLTLAPYGRNIHGIRAASLYYFDRPVDQLPLSYKAMLVALPQSPSMLRPDHFLARANMAKNKVLKRIESNALIPQHVIKEALEEQCVIKPQPFVKKALHAFLYTRHFPLPHLDKNLQEILQEAVQGYVNTLPKPMNAACIVYNYRTQEIVTYIGSVGDRSRFAWNNMCEALRSPGSTLKPFIFGLSMELGHLNPNTWIVDHPINLKGYQPENFEKHFLGEMRIEDALQKSLNTPVVQILNQLGAGYFFDWVKKQSIHPKMPNISLKRPNLAVGLGGLGLSLHDLVLLYGKLAQGKLFSTSVTNWITNTLLGSVLPDQRLKSTGIAFKTGTSYGFRDSLSIGYDDQHVVGIWVGRADGTPCLGFFSRVTAVPLMLMVFERLGIKPLSTHAAAEITHTNWRFQEQEAPTFQITMPKNAVVICTAKGENIFLQTNTNQLIQWYANGKFIGESNGVMEWKPTAEGFYKITANNDRGDIGSTTIEVCWNLESIQQNQ